MTCAAWPSAGCFREDLYYRLAVLPVELPPLRNRIDDIVPIAEYWLSRIAASSASAPVPGGAPTAAEGGRSGAAAVVQLSPEARVALREHDYPGNVRELVNVVRRIALFARGGVADAALVRRMLAEDPFRTLRPERPHPLGCRPHRRFSECDRDRITSAKKQNLKAIARL